MTSEPSSFLSRAVRGALALALSVAPPRAQPGASGAPAERCETNVPSTSSAPALIDRALAAIGTGRLHARYADVVSHRYESDRMYPPALTYVHTGELWTDRATGAQRVEETLNGGGVTFRTPALVATARASFAARGDSLVPFPALHASAATHRRRALDPLAVLADWREAARTGAVRAAGRCLYRDRWRTVVARAAAPDGFTVGEERLYLDPGSGLLVKLDRRERDALWGPVSAEYVYTNWQLLPHAVRYPVAVSRLADGAVDMTRAVAGVDVDSAPRAALPDVAPMVSWRPLAEQPDTVRVGANAFLLAARGYTSMVALANDTVVVLDATESEGRARNDSAWIARLFPGRHPVRVVVTDLAWPHVGGVRFWVARGATIVSHADSRPFLEEIVRRRWTDMPDALETLRARDPKAAPLRFVAARDSLTLGGVRVASIDGLGSEGALMVYLPDARFLWAGDYVQDARAPSAYAGEVIAALARHGLAPERVAAMHLPATPWSTVVAAQRGAASGAPR